MQSVKNPEIVSNLFFLQPLSGFRENEAKYLKNGRVTFEPLLIPSFIPNFVKIHWAVFEICRSVCRIFCQNFNQISHNHDGNISEFSEKMKFYNKSTNITAYKSPSKYLRPPPYPSIFNDYNIASKK